MKKTSFTDNKTRMPLIILSVLLFILLTSSALAFTFPAAGWHRGDVTVAQENSRKAITAALNSSLPNIEFDLSDFFDESGKRVGLVAHDYEMKRATGKKGYYHDYHNPSKLPLNMANRDLPGEPFMTVIEMFDLIKARKAAGVTPQVSLDLKEEKTGEEFGKWVGRLIREYGFQDHVFASSFFKDNVVGVKEACPECLVGGLVFDDQWALQFLSEKYTSLDLTTLSKLTFFLGFLGKKEYPHDFVLIQDSILLKKPELIDYWKNVRKVKFVGAFAHEHDHTQPYKKKLFTEGEWKILKRADWLELDPPQMRQYLEMKSRN